MSGRYAVIMAGGKGERFWPLSTSKHPKQLLALVGDKPLIAQAVDRLDGLIPPENVFTISFFLFSRSTSFKTSSILALIIFIGTS